MSAPCALKPVDIAQGQLDAYNAQDLDAFCAFYAEGVIVADLGGGVTGEGISALRARYAKLFAEFPKNRAELVNRIALNGAVIDHERVRRSPNGAPFEVGAIYTIADGKIARVDFVK
jgi:hypothetical protein